MSFEHINVNQTLYKKRFGEAVLVAGRGLDKTEAFN